MSQPDEGAAPSDQWITHRVRVRYGETDRMGVAHHGSYVAWFEEARTELMRQRGMSYRDMEDSGVLLQVVDLRITYKKSVTYDDLVTVRAAIVGRRRASVTIHYEMFRVHDEALVAVGETTLACTDRGGRVRRLPDDL